jgi:hypothetical protein
MSIRVAKFDPASSETVPTDRLAWMYKAVMTPEPVQDDSAQVFYHEGTDEIVLEELRDPPVPEPVKQTIEQVAHAFPRLRPETNVVDIRRTA